MSICLSVCLSPPVEPRTRPHRISRICLDTRIQGGRRHSVAKHSCYHADMRWRGHTVARTQGGADMLWCYKFITLPIFCFCFLMKKFIHFCYFFLAFFHNFLNIYTCFLYCCCCFFVQNKHT